MSDQGGKVWSLLSGGKEPFCAWCKGPIPAHRLAPSQHGKYCSRRCVSAARWKVPEPKVCPACRRVWLPLTRQQVTRTRACSILCGRRIGDRSNAKAAWTEDSYRRHREAISGSKNPSWKGGVTVFKRHGNYSGVRYVRAPQWARAMARADGYVMEHRLVVSRACGRLLIRTEVVNHKNHDPTDNRPENLELWPTNADHKRGEFGHFVPGVANRLVLEEAVCGGDCADAGLSGG
jgi:hypothetical protein